MKNFEALFSDMNSGQEKTIAVAAAGDEHVLKLVKTAVDKKIGKFILTGSKELISQIANKIDLDLTKVQTIDSTTDNEAAVKAVSLVRDGTAQLLMKGQLPTRTFLRAVLNKEKGIRTDRFLSQVSVVKHPQEERLLLITDCAFNVSPTLDEKIIILENAVGLAQSLGIKKPKATFLAPLETVNPSISSTVDAAILSKMAERNQFKFAVTVDGPLALDNALSVEAAEHKGIESEVAGKADILVVPDLNSGNILHKSLVFFANETVASIVLGAQVPIVMTSRSDTVETKLTSLKVAMAAYKK